MKHDDAGGRADALWFHVWGLGFGFGFRGLNTAPLDADVLWAREFRLPWRETGPNHLDDKVDSDQ